MPSSLRDYDAPISHTSEGNVEFSQYIRFDGSSPTTSNLDQKHFGAYDQMLISSKLSG